MTVVVQEMIPSEISGVTFTANPITGTTDEAVTDATWGMGAAIVDGGVSPDHFVVLRENRHVTTQRIANKISMVSTMRQEDDSRMMDVPQHLRNVSCLDDDMLQEVTSWAIKAEDHFQSPQDLEWAIYDGKFYMLQSRAITTLGEEDDQVETRKLVIFKPVAENFTEPILPLTQNVTAVPNPWVQRTALSGDHASTLSAPSENDG